MEKKIAMQIRIEEPWEKTAEMMAEAGFKYVAMSFGDNKPLLEKNWEQNVEKIGEVFSKNG